jgi:two-component system, chemotaxis family, sensor kinase CheA
MGDMTREGANIGAGIELTQFYQVFFDEAGENLDHFEAQLLEIDLVAASDDALNSIFRCAHSVKGGAATFGFADVAELTHQMETLLDKLRRHELAAAPVMVDVLLQSADALRAQLARHQGAGGEAVDTTALYLRLRQLAAGAAPAAAQQADSAAGAGVAAQDGAVTAATPALRDLELRVGPLADPAEANNLVELFQEIPDLGQIEPLDGGEAADGMRRFRVRTSTTDSDLLDLFTFHVARESVQLLPLGPGYGFHEGAPGVPDAAPAARAETAFGLFDGAPGAPREAAVRAPASPDKPAPVAAAAAADKATLRVSIGKVDQLINLVGELVITQAMLAQNSKHMDPALYQRIATNLADLDRNTRDLQQSVMSIRMIPMATVFARFPRMLRDLAARLGKQVEFVTLGEATELDKGLVEKITDPLTHLVRNSCDHGIELPAERIAKGKPASGTLTLAASHQGGSILIEVRDDGRGLSRGKLIAKARERGIDAPDSMTDAEAWALIFAPGFSTADVITDLSGRGVGMDVVKQNITALGGTVEIDSAEGYGMSVKVRLPLTLAIMDGMSVGVGDEVYILPLSSVIESFQAQPGVIKTMGGSAQVIKVRGAYLPVLDLEQVYRVPRLGTEAEAGAGSGGIVVVAEAEGSRVAMLVDELIGQQQVVVKNLEANYRRVSDVSGATIMGDGRVALIIDVGSLVRRARH